MSKGDPINWGGLIEHMYTEFPVEEIPDKIKALKKKLDRIEGCKNLRNVRKYIHKHKPFTYEEVQYLNSPTLDGILSGINHGESPFAARRTMNEESKRFFRDIGVWTIEEEVRSEVYEKIREKCRFPGIQMLDGFRFKLDPNAGYLNQPREAVLKYDIIQGGKVVNIEIEMKYN